MTSIVNMKTILKIRSSSWDERDPESNEVSDSYIEISASESDSEEKQDGDSREILVFLFW